MTAETRFTDLPAIRAGVAGFLAWRRRRWVEPADSMWVERVTRDLKEQGFPVKESRNAEEVTS